jgi:hypothetical protein
MNELRRGDAPKVWSAAFSMTTAATAACVTRLRMAPPEGHESSHELSSVRHGSGWVLRGITENVPTYA